MHNALQSNELQIISPYKTFKIEIQNGGPNNSDILQNWLPQEIRFPLFNLKKFQDSEKNTPESCRMLLNLINDEHFGTIKLLKLKYRMGDQIIQTFCKIRSPKKLGPPSLICKNFKTLRKILLNHPECIEI